MKLLLAVVLVILSGCASLRPNPDEWTDKERLAFSLSTAAHLADLGTTMAALDSGRCTELNPLLGSNPSNGSLIAVKALAIGLEYAFYNSEASRGPHSHWLGFVTATIIGGVTIHNLQQSCY